MDASAREVYMMGGCLQCRCHRQWGLMGGRLQVGGLCCVQWWLCVRQFPLLLRVLLCMYYCAH
jgi:hypothetical protein